MARPVTDRRSLDPRVIVARRVRYNALRKGLLGGSGPWLAVFVVLRLGRFVGKVTKRGEAPVIFSERMPPGVVVGLENRRPVNRLGRRAQRKLRAR